jgi:hypothetical protein
MTTDTIIAAALMFTASKKLDLGLDFRSLGTMGFRISTNTKEGRKIPSVASSAPEIP